MRKLFELKKTFNFKTLLNKLLNKIIIYNEGVTTLEFWCTSHQKSVEFLKVRWSPVKSSKVRQSPTKSDEVLQSPMKSDELLEVRWIPRVAEVQ